MHTPAVIRLLRLHSNNSGVSILGCLCSLIEGNSLVYPLEIVYHIVAFILPIVSNEQPRSKPKKAPEPSSGSHGNTTHVPKGGVASVGVSSGGSSRVQFMWQPLTEITYPTVMLLASFEVSVNPIRSISLL